MDETFVNSVLPSGQGFVPDGDAWNVANPLRRRPQVDHANVRTTLMATVCSCPALQPHLPQVFLPSCRGGAALPPRQVPAWQKQRYPHECWTGTGGFVTTTAMIRWATHVRSVVSSFNEALWIVLVLDCSTAHLDVRFLRHLRRLKILLLMVPAKLTWFVQLRDVYILAELKQVLRESFAKELVKSPSCTIPLARRVHLLACAVRETLVGRDWSEAFAKVGLATELTGIRHEIFEYVNAEEVRPRLPPSADFARLVGRTPGTVVTCQLHRLCLTTWLEVKNLAADARPPPGRVVAQPVVDPATKRTADQAHLAARTWSDVRMKLMRQRAGVEDGIPPALPLARVMSGIGPPAHVD